MTATVHNNISDNDVRDEKAELAECVENAVNPHGHIPATEIQARFPLLRDLSETQMTALNKSVLKKVDWHMMPCVTLMFLMK